MALNKTTMQWRLQRTALLKQQLASSNVCLSPLTLTLDVGEC